MNISQVLRRKMKLYHNGIILICCFVSAVFSAGGMVYAQIIEISENSSSFELPEWSKDFEEAEIKNRVLLDFLKEKIIPYFDNVDGKGENRLYLMFTGEKNDAGERVEIIAKSDCLTYSATEFRFNNPDEYNETYVTIISGVVVFLVNYSIERELSQLITPMGKRYKPNPEYWKPHMSIHDEAGLWVVHVTENAIILDWFVKGESDVFSKWNENE